MELSLNPNEWEILYSKNFTSKPATKGKDIAIPLSGNKEIHFLKFKKRVELGNAITLKGSIRLSKGAVFNETFQKDNECDVPSSFRPVIFKDMYGEFDRWYPTEGVFIKNGEFSLRVPLLPRNWVSVLGKSGADHPEQFGKLINQDVFVGVVWGYGCFYGHGVRMLSGSSITQFSSIIV